MNDAKMLADMAEASELLDVAARSSHIDMAARMRRVSEALAAHVQAAKACPNCPPGDGSWFGPCADGKNHRTTCPVGAEAMRETRWPCGELKYTITASIGEAGVPR